MVKTLIISILALLLTTETGQQSNEPPADDGTWSDSLAVANTAEDSLLVCHQAAQTSIFADTVLKYSLIEAAIAERKKDSAKLADAYSTIAWAHSKHGNRELAAKYYEKEYSIVSKTKDTVRIAKTLYNLGCTYNDVNKFALSLHYYQQALILFEKMGDHSKASRIHRDLAYRDINMKQYTLASQKLQKAIDLDRNNKDTISLAKDYYIWIWMHFNETKHSITIDELNELNAKADTIGIVGAKCKDKAEQGVVMFDYYHIKAILYGKIYTMNKQHWLIDSAYSYCDKALKYQSTVKSVENIVMILTQKAQTSYFEQNGQIGINITDYLKQRYIDSIGINRKMDIYKVASQCYEDVRNFEGAYVNMCEYVKCYIDFVSSLNVMENAEFNSKVNLQKIQNEKEIEKEKSKKEIQQQKRITTLIIIVLIIGTILLGLTLRALHVKRENVKILNDKNQQLSRQQEEIIAQRNVIEEQRMASERANLVMYQSIRYAKHIQSAALPSEEHIHRIFPDHFIYYEPKDIVSGDFYYATQNAGLDIFVLADCTGHGVPGGFLSMLGISAIKELLKNPEIDIMPGIILDMMREYIKQALANDEEVAEAMARGEESFSTADGMDMSIVAYDKYNHCLRFAGAYQSLYIVRNGEIIRLKGDRMPVGRHINESASFQTQLFDTQKDDMIYMSSDGIPSQIGFSGVKFMTKRLLDFFKSNYALPCETQKRNIANIMNDWLFGSTQIDDLSLVGIRITD